MGDCLLDLLALRRDIELAQARARTRGITRTERAQWIEYSDLLESALDIRIRLSSRDAASHERALEGVATTMCRQYTRTDPSFASLLAEARQTEMPAAATASI